MKFQSPNLDFMKSYNYSRECAQTAETHAGCGFYQYHVQCWYSVLLEYEYTKTTIISEY